MKIPTDPERDSRSPGPGILFRERWGWKPLLRTLTSGIWVLLGALVSEGLGGLVEAACSWERRGTYRTAWAVCPWSGCQCSYLYGQGPAIGPHTGEGCFRYLSSVWRAIAPHLSPWFADGDVPSAANLNLNGGSGSHVRWHCDDEPLFGGIGDPKLIVSLSLGSPVTFKWKAKSCSVLDAHCALRRFCLVGLLVIVGSNLTLLLGLGLLLRGRLLWSPSLVVLPPVWPASCVSAVDKSRSSKSAEVRRIWGIYDERLNLARPGDLGNFEEALAVGDASGHW